MTPDTLFKKLEELSQDIIDKDTAKIINKDFRDDEQSEFFRKIRGSTKLREYNRDGDQMSLNVLRK